MSRLSQVDGKCAGLSGVPCYKAAEKSKSKVPEMHSKCIRAFAVKCEQ